MSDNKEHISEKKQKLIKRADLYYHELEEATEDLQESSKKFGRNLLLIGAIGAGIFTTIRLLVPKTKKDQNEIYLEKNRAKKGSSRFTGALKALTMPILVGVVKNIVFSELDKEKKKE